MKFIVADKYGKLKESSLKSFDENQLYTKAGFKVSTHFTKTHSWKDIQIGSSSFQIISVYGKNQGKAGQENKYELPPPIDNTLFFGSIVIVHYNHDGSVNNLTKTEWKEIYEHLMGGFEDLDDDDDEEESEDELLEGVELDKNGYAKDGFVVDDDENDDDYEDYESELSEDEYFKN